MGLKVILDATPEHTEKLTIKHVNQRSLRGNLCISVRRKDLQCNALSMAKRYPLHVENM